MKRVDWNAASERERTEALLRPAQSREPSLREGVARILEQVRAGGDEALRALTRQFEGQELGALEVTEDELVAAEARLPASLKAAVREAMSRIETFHRASAPAPVRVQTAAGVVVERVLRPIRRVGLYVPAGGAPLPSTALMLAVPARLAGCPEILVCTPMQPGGRCDDAVLFAARAAGAHRVFKLGGAQAIAALAFGTATVPACSKIFGPGNAWVTEAKLQVSATPGGAAIDMPAGPSEVLVIADAKARAAFVAADLLSQAEHGPDSQVLLVTDSLDLLAAVAIEIERQCATLPRAATARVSLASSRGILVRDLAQAFEVSNRYAPEHLIVQTEDARRWLPRVESAGSVFLGPWTPESIGDYCSGSNHVLPTYGAAAAHSGLSVASFQKQVTVQELTAAGLQRIGPCATILAAAEQLEGHRRAVTMRLDSLRDSGDVRDRDRELDPQQPNEGAVA
jgi:histidinol dehydrogenase